MNIDQDSLEQFLSLSVGLTGFNRATLMGTGLLEEYYQQIVSMTGEAISQQLWEIARQLSARASDNGAATYIVIEDGRLNRRMPDQPYNLAMVTLDADPRVNFYSNLPGAPPYKVPVGAAVEVMFEKVVPGQLIHEWRVGKVEP